MSDNEALKERLRSSATAFREHPVYDSEGDGCYLTVQADELDEAADTITRLEVENERLTAALLGPEPFQLGRFGWLEAMVVDLKRLIDENPVARDAWNEDPDGAWECFREVEALIRDVRPILVATLQDVGESREGLCDVD